MTTEEWVTKARAVHGERYEYARTDYTGALNKVVVTCAEHGPFDQVANTHLRGKGCPACARERNTSAATRPPHEWARRAKSVHGDKYDYTLVKYTRSRDKVTIVCPSHGPFLQEAGKHLRGSGCPACGRAKAGRKPGQARASTRPSRRDAFIARAKSVHGDKYGYDGIVYVNSKAPVHGIACPAHGPFSQLVTNHLNGGGCPACGEARRRESAAISPLEWASRFEAVHGDKYDYGLVPPHVRAARPIDIVCKEHGVFSQAPYVHAAGHGCPRCAHQVSRPEGELYAYLLGVLPKGTVVRRNVRDVIGPHELDLFVPEYRLAIEFNGTYWHSHAKKPDERYHQKKALACARAGVKLVHVYEHLWGARRDQYLALIDARLGLYSRRLQARKLLVRALPHRTANDFLGAHHLQGSCQGAAHAHGLFLGDELVGVATYGRPRFSGAADWELLRLCYLPRVAVIGGTHKLFKHFLRECARPGERIISYASLDYSDGGVYERLGFTRDPSPTRPGYVWVRGQTTLSRYQAQRRHLPDLLGPQYDPNGTEDSNMSGAGYRRLFNAGNYRYTLVVSP